MCGILGLLGEDVGAELSEAALAALTHRGPDSGGQRAEPGVVFGHRRLSIIDLSPAGAQPMTNADESVVLTFNGEIYNHEALRAELQEKGYRFQGRCDAEVIVHLFDEKGIALVDDLIGMFAFALWDRRRGVLHLVRDRLGIKPLYWYDDGTRFAFASELGALTKLPGVDTQPDVTAWYDFLTYGFVPAPKTTWRHARKLPAAHRLEVSFDGRRAGPAKVTRWWDPPFEPEERPEAEVEEAFEELLARVVREHLISDVPVGMFLSGGVDSSLITAYTRSASSDPLQAFTISFPDRRDDEVDVAREIARRMDTPLTVGTFSYDELLATVPQLPSIFGEPFADHSSLPMLGLCRTAAAELKVVLSGDGGDETHLGYGRYLKPGRRKALYALADAVPGLSTIVGGSPLRSFQWLRTAAEGELGRRCHFLSGIPHHTKRMFVEVTSSELADYDDYWLQREHQRPELSTLARQQYLDLNAHLVEGILTKVDRTSMRFGLEVRPPLLDHRLVEFAGRLPDTLKIKAGVQKHLLRKTLAKHLPREIVYAKKRAFSVPIKRFMQEGLLGLERDIDVFGAFRIRREDVKRVLTVSKDSQKLWILFVLDLFQRHHQGEPFPEHLVKRQEAHALG